jgi:hypothetical protein
MDAAVNARRLRQSQALGVRSGADRVSENRNQCGRTYR